MTEAEARVVTKEARHIEHDGRTYVIRDVWGSGADRRQHLIRREYAVQRWKWRTNRIHTFWQACDLDAPLADIDYYG